MRVADTPSDEFAIFLRSGCTEKEKGRDVVIRSAVEILTSIRTLAIKVGLLAVTILANAAPVQAETMFDAAVFTNGKAYFFKSHGYYRFSGEFLDDGYPKAMNQWGGLPNIFMQGIDAALHLADNRKLYFFKGDEYVRLQGTVMDKGYPKKIRLNWHGLPARFHSNLDAALYRAGHTYFFKNGEYVRLTGTKMDPGYPKKLPGGWGLPAGFVGEIDAAIDHPVWKNNYFFTNDRYVRLTDTKLDKGYPRSNQTWRLRLNRSPLIDGLKKLVKKEERIDAKALVTGLNSVFNGTSLYLDNYNDGRGWAERFSKLTLPKQLNDFQNDKVIPIPLPEYKKPPFFYNINNVQSNRWEFASVGDKLRLIIGFESSGSEIIGRCFHETWCDIIGDDNTAPDIQWDNLTVTIDLKPVAKSGEVFLQDPVITLGGTPKFQGVCAGTAGVLGYDICDAAFGYRSMITGSIRSALKTELMRGNIQKVISEQIRAKVLNLVKIQTVETVSFRNGQFVITHEPPATQTWKP